MNTDLVRAIREKRLIEFTYKSGGVRIAEPHDYGIQKGIERLLALPVERRKPHAQGTGVEGSPSRVTCIACAFSSSDSSARVAIAVRRTDVGCALCPCRVTTNPSVLNFDRSPPGRWL